VYCEGKEICTGVETFYVEVKHPDRIRRVFTELAQPTPFVFLLAGPSESGKSHFGEEMLSLGGARIKILKVVAELQKSGEIRPTDTPQEILIGRSLGEHGRVIDSVIEMMTKRDVLVAAIESITYPPVVEAFRNHRGVRSLTVYLNPPRELRIKREAEKEDVPPNQIERVVSLKDEVKKRFGLPEVKEKADLLVVNAGGIEIYNQFIAALYQLAQESTREYSGNPFEYK
jgi:hypothetical protein